jgi:hypothetical protein
MLTEEPYKGERVIVVVQDAHGWQWQRGAYGELWRDPERRIRIRWDTLVKWYGPLKIVSTRKP